MSNYPDHEIKDLIAATKTTNQLLRQLIEHQRLGNQIAAIEASRPGPAIRAALVPVFTDNSKQVFTQRAASLLFDETDVTEEGAS